MKNVWVCVFHTFLLAKTSNVRGFSFYFFSGLKANPFITSCKTFSPFSPSRGTGACPSNSSFSLRAMALRLGNG